MKEYKTVSRRKMLSRGQMLSRNLAFTSLLPVLSWIPLARVRAAEEMPALSLDEPMAKSLQYIHDAIQVPESVRSVSEAFCHNCQLYTGDTESQWGPCAVFAGKHINRDGWCDAWVRKG